MRRWLGVKRTGYPGEKLDIVALWFFGTLTPIVAVLLVVYLVMACCGCHA